MYTQFITTVFMLALLAPMSVMADSSDIIGKNAPEFGDLTWYDKDNKEINEKISVKDYRGKVVILKFWQSWCPGCLSRGLPTLYKLQEHFKNNKKVKLFTVQTVFEGFGINSRKQLSEIRKRYSLTIPMAHDDGSSHNANRSVLMSRYRSGGTPWFVIINPQGKIVFNGFHLKVKKTISYIESLLDGDLSPVSPLRLFWTPYVED